MKLYEISQQHQGALSLIESGELSSDDLADTIEGLEGEFKQKAISVVKYSQNSAMVANAKKDLAKKLMDEAKAIESRNDNLIQYLDSQMQKTGITEIACDYFKIKYKKLPDIVEVDDTDSLPKKYINEKTVKTPDTMAIKKDLQAEKEVEGAKLITDRKKLEIK